MSIAILTRSLLVTSLVTLSACKEVVNEDLPDWDEGMVGGGGIDTDTDTEDSGDTGDLVETFSLTLPELTYDPRLHATGSQDGCEVEPDGTPEGYVDIECTYDIAELDLYGNGMDFRFNVPEGACEYVVYWHYQYEAWEVGTGPGTVSWEVDAAGNISNEVNSVNGVPYCQYDYKSNLSDDAPNCCLGNYSLTITNTTLGVSSTAGPISWGGRESSCYGGASFHDPEAILDDQGWPVGRIIYLNQEAWVKDFTWDLLALEYRSNVVLANYYEPAQHGGTLPAGLNGAHSQPYYTFQCYDHAEELLAQIQLVVREWNEQTEFYSVDGSGVPNGDPETVGTEPVTGLPIDDRNDWATATPGNTDYLEFLE